MTNSSSFKVHKAICSAQSRIDSSVASDGPFGVQHLVRSLQFALCSKTVSVIGLIFFFNLTFYFKCIHVKISDPRKLES